MNLKQSIFRKYQDEEGDGEAGAGRRSFLIKKRGSLRSFLKLHSFCSFEILHSFYSFQCFQNAQTFPENPIKRFFSSFFTTRKEFRRYEL